MPRFSGHFCLFLVLNKYQMSLRTATSDTVRIVSDQVQDISFVQVSVNIPLDARPSRLVGPLWCCVGGGVVHNVKRSVQTQTFSLKRLLTRSHFVGAPKCQVRVTSVVPSL